MKQIFDKKLSIQPPKRTLLHKLQILSTSLWVINLLMNLILAHTLDIFFSVFFIFFSGIQWFTSSKQYKEVIANYEEELSKQQYEEDMKNAFNFGSYQIK